MSSLSSSIADGEALLARSWSDLLEDWPGESETILKFGEKMLGTFGLWALTQPYFDLDAKNREAEPGVAFFNGGPIIEPTKKNLSAIRQDPCQADACRDAETAIQVLDSLLKVELEDDLHDLLWQCRLVALDLQVIASMPPLEPLSQWKVWTAESAKNEENKFFFQKFNLMGTVAAALWQDFE